MYKFIWECTRCEAENVRELPWVKICDGQGFTDSCSECDKLHEIDINVNVYPK